MNLLGKAYAAMERAERYAELSEQANKEYKNLVAQIHDNGKNDWDGISKMAKIMGMQL